MLQSEYRQALQYSSITSDFSFLVGSDGTKSHFFYNQFGELNKNTNLAEMSNLMQKDNIYKSKYIVEVLKLFENDLKFSIILPSEYR